MRLSIHHAQQPSLGNETVDNTYERISHVEPDERRDHRTAGRDRNVPAECPNLDEVDGGFVPGQHYFCLFKNWRSVDPGCLCIEWSGIGDRQDAIP